MYQQATRFPSHEHAVSQLVDHADNIAGASVLDELRRNLAAEQLLPREQPKPDVGRLVEVGQLIGDIFQIEQQLLGVGTREGPPLVPAMFCLRLGARSAGTLSCGCRRPRGASPTGAATLNREMGCPIVL